MLPPLGANGSINSTGKLPPHVPAQAYASTPHDRRESPGLARRLDDCLAGPGGDGLRMCGGPAGSAFHLPGSDRSVLLQEESGSGSGGVDFPIFIAALRLLL